MDKFQWFGVLFEHWKKLSEEQKLALGHKVWGNPSHTARTLAKVGDFSDISGGWREDIANYLSSHPSDWPLP